MGGVCGKKSRADGEAEGEDAARRAKPVVPTAAAPAQAQEAAPAEAQVPASLVEAAPASPASPTSVKKKKKRQGGQESPSLAEPAAPESPAGVARVPEIQATPANVSWSFLCHELCLLRPFACLTSSESFLNGHSIRTLAEVMDWSPGDANDVLGAPTILNAGTGRRARRGSGGSPA